MEITQIWKTPVSGSHYGYWKGVATVALFLIAVCMVPSGMKPTRISDVFRFCKKRVRAWAYLFDGPRIIHYEYQQSNGEPFLINAPDVGMTFVSSPKHIKEVDHASDEVLSLNGAAKHMLQPVYTMNGFNWFDRRGVEGVGFVRTLRTLLTNHLPDLLPEIGFLARAKWAELLSERKALFHTSRNYLRSIVSHDDENVKDPQFMASALGYVEETLVNAEIVKLLPGPLAQCVGGLLSRCLSSHKTFFQRLLPATEQRILEKDLRRRNQPVPNRTDCIQWIIDTAPKNGNPWSAERVIYELMAIWFGSVHILSTTIVYVVHDLCLHPEYIEPLRAELKASFKEFERTGKGLPLLDSFIKESSRLTPVESMSVRRRALKPFQLSGGTRVETGEWICAASGSINTSPEYYPSPLEFSGFRFVESALSAEDRESCVESAVKQPKPSKLTDVDHSFLMWGTGRMACPGRYYATAFMKVVIAQLLMNYDFSLVKPNAPRWISWRVARIPRPWTQMTFTPRSDL
ncbi:Cytochrome P475 monooxygenase [Paramyrothecium foliicola]|nr:Cytochrome P475 monooxygenase [Paramyrothecium foliicola]